MDSAFPYKKILPENQSLLITNKIKANVCRNSTFQVNTRHRTKITSGKRRLTFSSRAAMSALHAKNDTTNLFGHELGELTENVKALLFVSGKETIQLLKV